MSIRSKYFVFAAAALISASVFGCKKSSADSVPLIKAGTLFTCTHIPYAPFQVERDGKIAGFDVDVIDLVAKKLGVKQQFVDTSLENLKSGALLNSNQCDLIAAGMTITPERQKNVDFSEPYFDAYQVLLVKRGSGLTNLDGIKASRKLLGAQSQTVGEDFAKAKGLTPLSFESSDALQRALRSNQVDAVIEDHPVVQTWMKDANNIGFQIAARLDTGEQLGIAVKKGNTKLLAAINEVLSQARADGTYKRLHDQWFGESLGAVPAAVAKP